MLKQFDNTYRRFGEKLVSPPTLRETPVPHQSGRISPIVPPSLASSSSTAIKQRGSGKPTVPNLCATLSSAPIPDKRSNGAVSQRRVTVAAPSPAQMIIKSAVVTSTAPVLRTTVSIAASKQSFDLRLVLYVGIIGLDYLCVLNCFELLFRIL